MLCCLILSTSNPYPKGQKNVKQQQSVLTSNLRRATKYRLVTMDNIFTGNTCHPPIFFFFFLSVFSFTKMHESQNCRGMWRAFLLTPHYLFHKLHRHLDISWAITAESSPVHIASSRTRSGNLWFPSANC